MYRIGKFSILAKQTVKTLRYYEKEGILIPKYVSEAGYRYYESSQLMDVAHIIFLKELGLSIKEIKQYKNKELLDDFLNEKRIKILNEQMIQQNMLQKINYMLEGKI